MSIPIATLTKYAAELRTYVLDFSQFPEIIEGDTIASITSIAATPSGLTIGSQAIVGDTIEVVLSAGTAGTQYTVSCIIVTSSGAILQGDGILSVI